MTDAPTAETAAVAAPRHALTTEQMRAHDTVTLALSRIKALTCMIECALESAENPEGGTYTPTHQDLLEVTSLIHELASTSRTALRAF